MPRKHKAFCIVYVGISQYINLQVWGEEAPRVAQDRCSCAKDYKGHQIKNLIESLGITN